MKITILTLFPKMISGFFGESIIKRAKENGLVDISLVDLRKFAVDKYGSVDDRPYGGGAGMIMRVDVIHNAIKKITNDELRIKNKNPQSVIRNLKSKIILTSPKGKIFNQQLAINYSKLDELVIIAGHYEGVDERVSEMVDEEVSIGDFVMTGGEMAAAVITDSVVRLLPGVLKKEKATELESFFEIPIKHLNGIIGENEILKKLIDKGVKDVKLLEFPQYTRPEEFNGKKVPEILLSGNHKTIEEWRIKKAFEETLKKRPDLLM